VVNSLEEEVSILEEDLEVVPALEVVVSSLEVAAAYQVGEASLQVVHGPFPEVVPLVAELPFPHLGQGLPNQVGLPSCEEAA
tara:strand:- start:488 stop:733 length:246 start_codon:yes stop_codon:yes gene_type:complete